MPLNRLSIKLVLPICIILLMFAVAMGFSSYRATQSQVELYLEQRQQNIFDTANFALDSNQSLAQQHKVLNLLAAARDVKYIFLIEPETQLITVANVYQLIGKPVTQIDNMPLLEKRPSFQSLQLNPHQSQLADNYQHYSWHALPLLNAKGNAYQTYLLAIHLDAKQSASSVTQGLVDLSILFLASIVLVAIVSVLLLYQFVLTPLRILGESIQKNQTAATPQLLQEDFADDFNFLAKAYNKLLLTKNQQNAELIKSARAADRANAAKSQFLATMSHEIRTPINGIMGMLNLCLETQLNDKQQHFVKGALQSSESLLHIINDILDYSKVESGRLELEKIEFGLDDIIERLKIQVINQARQKSIDLYFAIPPEIAEMTYRGDPHRIGQVLLNLTSNAIKFTKQGSVTVRAVCSANGLLLSVQDTGIGLTPEQKENLFTPFTQADSSTTREYGGTGLGLAICKNIVEQMCGGIEIHSRYKLGSTFNVFLPLMPEKPITKPQGIATGRALLFEPNEQLKNALRDQLNYLDLDVVDTESPLVLNTLLSEKISYQLLFINLACIEQCREALLNYQQQQNSRLIFIHNQATTQLSEQEWPEEHSLLDLPCSLSQVKQLLHQTTETHTQAKVSFANKNILLVEDNAINAEIAKQILLNMGFSVDWAENGLVACQKINSQHDLVLMDIQMPIMDGLEATAEIRKKGYSALPILAMTANAMQGDRQKCIDAGMDDYLTKPIDMAKLRMMLQQWLKVEQINEQATKHTRSTLDKTPTQNSLTHTASTQTHSAQVNPPQANSTQSLIFDCATALERLSGNSDLLKLLVQKFSEEFSKAGTTLADLLHNSNNADNLKQAQILNHTLKGTAANLGFDRLSEACKKIDMKFKQEQAVATEDLEQFNTALALSMQHAQQYIAQTEQA
ncbi:hypothetical protein C2869_21580 [Saccharobesus litoralis]|uniref:Sensory/regulatory protein RpfC n=1 Tax=Saccharobesus litoralis TaxID=2172099 RepID=A0A2S0VX94_9ALTE|nr:ATP-binding protein [Saccharobesus litoralis]AWB68831.1 hypothetical protein C2869_21580 [Saccharobesus litoralis]